MDITKFLQSRPGNFSSTRLMFVVGLCWSMTITTLGFFLLKWNPAEGIAVFSSTSAVFTALKLIQKPMEGKSNSIENAPN